MVACLLSFWQNAIHTFACTVVIAVLSFSIGSSAWTVWSFRQQGVPVVQWVASSPIRCPPYTGLLRHLPYCNPPNAAFALRTSFSTAAARKNRPSEDDWENDNDFDDDDDDMEMMSGGNWITPSFDDRANAEMEMTQDFIFDENTSVLDNSNVEASIDELLLLYDMGVDGALLETGPLSLRMYTVMKARFLESSRSSDATTNPNRKEMDDDKECGNDSISELMESTLRLIAMQSSAREAVQAILQQSGLELASSSSKEKKGKKKAIPSSISNDELFTNWGTVESIRLLEEDDDSIVYNSWESASEVWRPGQNFNIVVRQIPVQRRKISFNTLLQSIDPDGALRQQAQLAGMKSLVDEEDTIDNEDYEYDFDDDESDIMSLADLAAFNKRRSEHVPLSVPDQPYIGTKAASYSAIYASDLAAHRRFYSEKYVRNDDPDDNDVEDDDNITAEGRIADRTTRHVMDALVSHGCLIVDVTNGGSDWEVARVLQQMWNTTEWFFDEYVAKSESFLIPGLQTAAGVGSSYAKVGFASYDGGNLQFLETRRCRNTGALLPIETQSVIGNEGSQSLLDAFQKITAICEDVVRVVVAASTEETGLLSKTDSNAAASKLVEELLDNGRPLPKAEQSDSTLVDFDENIVSMSPQRLCRYALNDLSRSNEQEPSSFQEVFGAHTDSTFLTAVPVAAVAGLEVYDDAAALWYRPELAALQQLNEQDKKRIQLDVDVKDKAIEHVSMPWYTRYIVLMPGELLQLASRDEVIATVHRVVAASHSNSSPDNQANNLRRRLSAPILLRGRPGLKWDCDRYMGGPGSSPVLKECNGMTVQDIHGAMQPSKPT